MDNIKDIMAKRDFDQPAEVVFIRDFVKRNFNSEVSVIVQIRSITITTPSASLAGSLRPQLHKLKKELQTEKKIFIRIG